MNKPLWLVSMAVAVISICLGVWIYNKVLDGSDNKLRLYQTSIKVTDADQFNYTVTTKQGNVMAYGQFKGVDLVKFPEMNKSFTYVRKVREEYTRHESCSTDSDGNRSCTTYYSWDYSGDDEKVASQVEFMKKKYNTSLFDFHDRDRPDASTIIKGETKEYYYPERGNWFGWESEGDTRYYYEVMNPTFMGSILVNTYDGTLKNAEGNGKITVYNQTVDQRLDGAKGEAVFVKWLFIITWTLLTIGLVAGSVYLLYDYF